jgi:predicted enzyme related to lactoylglutathione lyase
MPTRYTHTNVVARDWRRLAAFYQEVFGCVPLPPERHLTAPWVAAITGVAGAEIHGQHLRLPGYGEAGPTLEIFQYNLPAAGPAPCVNRPGLAHLAFAVDDVAAARAAVLAAGGGAVGEVATTEIPQAGRIMLAYVTDPEGNVIELQRWFRD